MSEPYTIVSLTAIRKAIATRMIEAKQSIPHYRIICEVNADALVNLRRELQSLGSEVAPSINDLMIKAVAQTLMEVPDVNIQWSGTEIHRYHHADISIVTALPSGGLSTPIVRAAESKSVWEISREIKALILRAESNTLRMSDIVGGSFSISNLGMYGIDQFDAIINAPQCAILAIGAAKPGLVVSPDNEPRVATVMRITLSADHRAIDGVVGAAFMSALRRRLEAPDALRIGEVR